MVTRRGTDDPFMLRGSLFTFRRRCGKPSCWCAQGDGHESPALSYTQDGTSKTLTLTGASLSEVRAGLARYARARAELDRAADAGIAGLRAQLRAGSKRPRKATR
ncbi:MAG TPA: DUF6788 family protein [Acidimicrobiales bacterium]|nr:DUF6788 family protein [Acidimicrobiales bacterium]